MMKNLIVNTIKNGIVLDHIKAGRAMQIYSALQLNLLDCTVAIVKNVKSAKMGKKDLIKIDEMIDLNLDALGFIDPNITINIIRDGETAEKRKLTLPPQLTNIARCKNPRCITAIEQEIDHIFKLTREAPPIYRCAYCETALRNE